MCNTQYSMLLNQHDGNDAPQNSSSVVYIIILKLSSFVLTVVSVQQKTTTGNSSVGILLFADKNR